MSCYEVLAAFAYESLCGLCIQGSMDSYASAAERQASFTAQTSSPPDSFLDPLSRPGSFVSASGSSFPARGASATPGTFPDSTLEIGSPPQTLDVDHSVLSDSPPSQQRGWQ